MAWTIHPYKSNAKARTSSAVSESLRKAIIEQAKLPRQERKSIMANTLKVRNNSLRNNCAVLEGVVLRFDAQGVAETALVNRAVIQREMDRRPGRFFFVEEVVVPVVVETPVLEETAESEIEKDLLNALDTEEDTVEEEVDEDENLPEPPKLEEEKTTKRGRPPVKGKKSLKNK